MVSFDINAAFVGEIQPHLFELIVNIQTLEFSFHSHYTSLHITHHTLFSNEDCSHKTQFLVLLMRTHQSQC